MSDAAAEPEEEPVKSGKKPLILAIVLALVGSGGGFYAATSGLIPGISSGGGDDHMEKDMQGDGHGASTMDNHGAGAGHDGMASMPDIGDLAYVEVEPITISLTSNQAVRHLRFRAQLEVSADHEDDVMAILPRVTDVMNSYLRAVELSDLTGPLALTRLRAQMLRRIQIVTGKGRVRDLLIMEFVLN